MRLTIKQGGGLPYARKEPYEYDGTKYEADLQINDVVKILDSGEKENGNFGEQTMFKIKTRNGDKKLAFNQATINVLVEELGENTENWVNKEVKVLLRKALIGGKKKVVPYLVIEGWVLDEYGELNKTGHNIPTSPQNTPQSPNNGENTPVKQSIEAQGMDTSMPVDDEEPVDITKIPF